MKKKAVRFLSVAACLLLAAAIGFAAKMFPVTAENGTGESLISYLPKTDLSAPLGTEANPFTVLDIVPNKSMGMIGYMIPGCEPVDMETLAADPGLSADFKIDLIDPGIFAGGADNYRYAFYDGLPEGAEITENIYEYPQAYGKWCRFANETNPGYSEYGYYENVGFGNGSYKMEMTDAGAVFSPQEGGGYNWTCTGYYYPAKDGEGMFERTGDAALGYQFTEAAGGAFAWQAVAGDWPEEGLTDPDTYYWTLRTDAAYYRYLYYGYQNMDVLIPYSFDGASSYGGFLSQVITVTPDELTDQNLGIIENADLICITAQNYTVKYWEKHNKGHEVLTEEEKGTTDFIGPSGNDLSWNAVLSIMEKMASDSPAAMILQFDKMYSSTPGSSGRYNIEKLYLMLMQYGSKAFYHMFIADTENFKAQETTVDGRTFVTGAYLNPEKPELGFQTTWDKETFKTGLGVSVMHESDFPQGQSEVFGTILTYNGDMSMLREFLNPGKIGEVKPNGNEWYKLGTNSEVFDYYQDQDGSRPGTISMNQATKYILANAGRTPANRKKLHILELQPCNQFIYGNYGWQLYYMNLLPWFQGDLNEDLTVTTMTTYQFIGDITDLNSEYDLVLFGSSQDGSNGLYGYNDSSMNTGEWEGSYKKGLLYTGIGDLVDTKGGAWSYGSQAWSDAGSDAYLLKARYSGNDITRKKYEEIKDYLLSDNPVVVSQKLYSGTAMDTKRVDSSSNMFQLGNLTYQPGKNESLLFREDGYRDSQGYDRLKGTLMKTDCELIFPEDGSGYPTVYRTDVQDGHANVKDAEGNTVQTVPVSGVISSVQYLTGKDESGNPLLRYEFTLNADAAYTYGVRLFIDRNGDGIFAGSIKENKEIRAVGKEPDPTGFEEVSGLSVWDVTGGEAYGVNDGTLLAGHRYVVTRSIPSSETGILPWKLEVYAKENDSIRCSESNFTLPDSAGQKKDVIRVLQMNLRPDMKENGNTTINFADQTTLTGAKTDAYLKALEQYNVEIIFLENSEWYDLYGENGQYAVQSAAERVDLIRRWIEYLDDIDMMVIGLSDTSSFTNNDIFYEGFRDFVGQGKSVILSHNVVKDASFSYADPSSVTEHDAELRTAAGMRRKYYASDFYHYSSTELNGSSLGLVLSGGEEQKFNQHINTGLPFPYDAYKSEVLTNIPDGEGYASDIASEFMDNSVKLLMNYSAGAERRDRILGADAEISWPGGAVTNQVRLLNAGQITNYPYVLADTLTVGSAHAQSFQLDLEQDDGGDVTVWYNLSDGAGGSGVYSSRPNDARNSYYTYTKGNIIYTGMGLSADGQMTDDEIKLFVNTIISAYKKTPPKPYIKVTNEEASVHDDIYTMYVMLTGAEKETDFMDVNFTVVEESLTNTAGKEYELQFQNADGEALSVWPEIMTPDGAAVEFDEGEAAYKVRADGKYYFKAPYQKILDEGEACYYMELCSKHTVSGKVIETRKVTKVVIYAMPLFLLN